MVALAILLILNDTVLLADGTFEFLIKVCLEGGMKTSQTGRTSADLYQ